MGRNNKRNARVNGFMKKMLSMSNPIDLDYPKDRKRADGGVRKRNIAKVSNACKRLIKVKRC